MKNEFIVNSDTTFGAAIGWINDFYQEHKFVRLTATSGKNRSSSQNNSIHLYCRMVAKELNDNGFSAYIDSPILKQPMETDWSMEMVKDLWRTVQVKLYPMESLMQDSLHTSIKGSTKILNKKQVSEVYDVINRALIEKTDGKVCVPFPSQEYLDAKKENRTATA